MMLATCSVLIRCGVVCVLCFVFMHYLCIVVVAKLLV